MKPRRPRRRPGAGIGCGRNHVHPLKFVVTSVRLPLRRQLIASFEVVRTVVLRAATCRAGAAVDRPPDVDANRAASRTCGRHGGRPWRRRPDPSVSGPRSRPPVCSTSGRTVGRLRPQGGCRGALPAPRASRSTSTRRRPDRGEPAAPASTRLKSDGRAGRSPACDSADPQCTEPAWTDRARRLFRCAATDFSSGSTRSPFRSRTSIRAFASTATRWGIGCCGATTR